MDFTTILGIAAGLLLIVWAIVSNGDLRGFYDFSSILITVGGTFSATFASFPFKMFMSIGKHMRVVLKRPKHGPDYYISTIVELAQLARQNGILSLEDKAIELKQTDAFLSESIMLIVDAIEPEKTKEMLEIEFENLEARHAAVWAMYEKAASYAPAFGMIGTLIGLVNMLINLDMNSDAGAASLTAGMATALLTTLYGSMLANLVFMPMAHKLRARHEDELICKEIIAEGVLAIQAGDNPRYIELRLKTFLKNKERNKKKAKAKQPVRGSASRVKGQKKA